MIVTVTPNTALDRTLQVPNLAVGSRHRTEASLALPGGKGVNVARALKTLGQPVIATGFVGGRTGTQIVEELTAEGILNDFARIGDESRTSTAIIDPTSGDQTEINEAGPQVSADEVELLVDKIRYLSRGADLFVLAGSLPPGVPVDFYARLLSELRGRDKITAIDCTGPPVREGLVARPGVVSPNVREAEEIVGHEFADDEDIRAAAGSLAEMGAETVLIHDESGCIAAVQDRRGGPRRFYQARLSLREVVSTVGSGDAFLAGYISARYDGASDETALALAVACGTANTQRYGAGVFDPRDVEAFRRQVVVEPLDG